MRVNHLFLLGFLLSACSLYSVDNDHGGVDDGSSGGAGALGSTNPSGRVCLYEFDSFFICGGLGETHDSGLKCAQYDDLDACAKSFEGSTFCDGGCCRDETTWGHRIVDGPCDEALKREDGTGGASGAPTGGSGGGTSGGAGAPTGGSGGGTSGGAGAPTGGSGGGTSGGAGAPTGGAGGTGGGM